MTRKLALITLVASLALATTAQAGKRPFSGLDEDDPAHRILGQIGAKMLHDGLQLTPAQKTDLARLIRQHQADMESFRGQRTEGREDVVKALTAARDELYRTGAISPATRDAVAAAHRARRESRGEGAAMDKRPRIKDELATVLTPQQLEYLEGFNPMKELGFEREGKGAKGFRGGHGGGPGHRIERLRELPADEYTAKRAEILEKLAGRLRERGETEAEITERTQKLGAKLDLLRSGSDSDVDDLREDLGGMMHEGRGGKGFGKRHHDMAKLMLLGSPEFLALLEGRDPLTASR